MLRRDSGMTRGPYRSKPIPGSFAELIGIFRTQSPRYRGWARATRKHADKVLDDFRVENGRRQASDLRFEDIVRLRDSMADVPAAANNWLKVISALMRYAKRIGYIDADPMATKLESLPPNRPGGHRTWRDDEIEAYRAHWPLGTTARLVFELAAGTAASGVDLVQLGWPHVTGDRIRYRRQKTERRKGAEETPEVNIPILPELAEALAHVPRDRLTFFETEWGLPRSQGSLVHKFRAWVAEAGLGAEDRNGRHLTLHGLRKAMGRRLAERGASPHVIMAVLGHESIASAQVYTKAYDRARAADMAAKLLSSPGDVTNVTSIRRPK
jgi:integrase